MGSGTYFAQEGVFEFGAREWGPQPLQLIAVVGRLQRRPRSAWLRDAGVKEIKDLKGKRVGFVVGLAGARTRIRLRCSPSAVLKQSDVKVVEFASYGAMWKGHRSTTTPTPLSQRRSLVRRREAETRRAALIWPPLPS